MAFELERKQKYWKSFFTSTVVCCSRCSVFVLFIYHTHHTYVYNSCQMKIFCEVSLSPSFFLQPRHEINKQQTTEIWLCLCCVCKCVVLAAYMFRRSQSFIGCKSCNISYLVIWLLLVRFEIILTLIYTSDVGLDREGLLSYILK